MVERTTETNCEQIVVCLRVYYYLFHAQERSKDSASKGHRCQGSLGIHTTCFKLKYRRGVLSLAPIS